RADGSTAFGAVHDGRVHVFSAPATLGDLLAVPDPAGLANDLTATSRETLAVADVHFLPPVDDQEVWAAGVTYKRSKIAREEESAGAAQFYDKVYTAPRPELFMKATPERVVGPGQPVRIRADGKWNVPEPELALVVSPALKIVGYTIGNDMSSRDIEGENPLYLPQAKIYKGSCAVGPLVTPVHAMPPLDGVEIRLVITRGGKVAFEGATTLAQMARTPESLVDWLGRENEFPNGVVLLTGTGIVPPDEFTLASGDDVAISIAGIGTLNNRVA
ncbi:MAG TPA: fumarylacetoacetate hydrolase family protein, partial [Gemmataceae bacterium]|nr:fumarylacetoacetate hydrolase family protein [Gemmataceae bacterium]